VVPSSQRASRSPLIHAVSVVDMACRLAGPFDFVDQSRAELSRRGVIAAVRDHNDAALFDWLMSLLCVQVIADRVVAKQYIREHGNATWSAVKRDLAQAASCPKLGGYWLFDDCRYEKGSGLCREPGHRPTCPLPRHDLRNGRLNQTAYSLFLFMRDAANRDFIQWIDNQLAAADGATGPYRLAAMRDAVVEPLCGIYGVSDKVVTMALSTLMIGAGSHLALLQRRWSRYLQWQPRHRYTPLRQCVLSAAQPLRPRKLHTIDKIQ
jgi:hypothetical protein